MNINEYYYNFENRPIYRPELSTFIFYENKELGIHDYSINNKFIKRENFIIALNSLNYFYSHIYMILGEDALMNYLIQKNLELRLKK